MKTPARFSVLLVLFILCFTARVNADIISDSVPDGTADRVNNNDFIGLLDGVSPNQIGGLNVNFPGAVPAGESFQLGDLVGRDINATSGSRSWNYQLILPADAVAGTGFTNISFAGHAFERATNNLEGIDQIQWELYLNNDVTPVQVGGPAAGSDWSTFDVNLSDPGGSTITSVRVVFTVTGFNGGGEWFVTRGLLQAEYQPIPEPLCFSLLSMVCLGLMGRKRKLC